MRVLYVTWLDPATTDYPLFLTLQWRRMGHEVQLLPYDLALFNRACVSLRDSLAVHDTEWSSSVLSEKVERVCADYRPDVLLFNGSVIIPEAMRRLRDRYKCLIGFTVGYNNLVERFVVESIRVADFLVVHDSYLLRILQGSRYDKTPHVFMLLSAAEPLEHHPIKLSREDVRDYGVEVAFIGGMGANRADALRGLPGFGLAIWGGQEWKRIPELAACFRNEPIYGLKKTKIYNAAKIVLNIEDDEKQINAFSQRIPEVLACGGFVITDWHQDLEGTSLVDGESIVTFRSNNELREKVAYYLCNPTERKRISDNGRKVVLESMTYEHVATPLIRDIERVFQTMKQ